MNQRQQRTNPNRTIWTIPTSTSVVAVVVVVVVVVEKKKRSCCVGSYEWSISVSARSGLHRRDWVFRVQDSRGLNSRSVAVVVVAVAAPLVLVVQLLLDESGMWIVIFVVVVGIHTV